LQFINEDGIMKIEESVTSRLNQSSYLSFAFFCHPFVYLYHSTRTLSELLRVDLGISQERLIIGEHLELALLVVKSSQKILLNDVSVQKVQENPYENIEQELYHDY